MNKIFKQEMLSLQDEKFQLFQKKICPTNKKIIGVKLPLLKAYSKNLLDKYSFEFLMDNIDNEYYEEIMLQGILIGQVKEDFNILVKYIEIFVPKIDNWAVCDTFCSGLKITNKYDKEMWNIINIYIKSNKEFEIRFAVVMILDYYIKDEYLEKIFNLFDNINTNYYYAKMAISWAISICLIGFYDRTIKYLQCCKLDNFTYNKAIQKGLESYRLDKNKKEILRKMKRK